MNEREREQERENENDGGHVSPKSSPLSPSSSPSPRGDPPTARLFVFFFSRGRRKRFYARGEKFENFSYIRVCVIFACAHIYIHIHTRGRETGRKRKRERMRERVREIITERKEVFIKMLFIIIFFILPHFLTLPEPREAKKLLNIHSPIFAFLFFFLRNTKGETHLFSL